VDSKKSNTICSTKAAEAAAKFVMENGMKTGRGCRSKVLGVQVVKQLIRSLASNCV